MEKKSEEDKDNPTITIIKMLFLAASCDPCSTSMVPKLPTLALCICFYFFLVKCLYLLLMKWFYLLILLCIFLFCIPNYVLVFFVYQVILSFNPFLFCYFYILCDPATLWHCWKFMKILKPTTKRRQLDPCIVHIVVTYAPIDMHTTKLAGMFIYSIGLSLFTAFRFAQLEFSSWSFTDCSDWNGFL